MVGSVPSYAQGSTAAKLLDTRAAYNTARGISSAQSGNALQNPNQVSEENPNSIKNLNDLQLERPSNETLAKSAFYKPASPVISMADFSAAKTQNSADIDGKKALANLNKSAETAKQSAANSAEAVDAMKKSEALKPNTGCETCQTRQYKDGSNDSGVSFQGSKHVPAATAAITVASHEGEHVTRDTAKAQAENRLVVKKTVTMQMACCPECKKMYVAGGTTSMTTVDAGTPAPSGNANIITALDMFGGKGDNVDVYA